MASAASFSTSDEAGNFAGVSDVAAPLSPAGDVPDLYQLHQVLRWIDGLGQESPRLALQFPDSLLPDSVAVAEWLEGQREGLRCYVLADTSYGSCCVDEVAAAHVSADALVHFGDACLSRPPEALPVHFVFPQHSQPVHLPPLPDQVLREESPLVLLYEVSLASQASALLGALAGHCPSQRLLHATPLTPAQGAAQGGPDGWVELGREVRCGEAVVEEAPAAFVTAFVGSPDSALLTLWRLSHPQSHTVVVFDPSSGDGAWKSDERAIGRMLTKRLYLVEKVKDAGSLGIVGGAMGVGGQTAAIRRAEQLAAGAGKQVMTLAVGKLNPAKLANFASDVDVFALAACPFGLLLDTKDHFRPIVSLFEVELALNAAAPAWDPSKGLVSDFARLQAGAVGLLSESGLGADVSLTGGGLRPPPNADGPGDGQLLPYNPGDYFKGRTWRGLEGAEEATLAPADLEDGRQGRAQGYATEPPN